MSFNTQKYGAMTKEHRRKKGFKMKDYFLEAMRIIRKARIKDFVSIEEIDNVAKHLEAKGTITKRELKALLGGVRK